MGLRYKKRDRLERVGRVPDELLASIGQTNINYERFDEQIVYDKINAKLDKESAKIKS